VRRSTVLLKNEELAGDVTYIRQHNVTAEERHGSIGSIHLDSRLDEYQTSFDIPTGTIRHWLHTDSVQSRRFAATSFFLAAVGT